MRFPGRHGTLASSELESLVRRNGTFLAVIRAGTGDGEAGLYNSVTGDYYGPICGGRLSELSTHRFLAYGCACTPRGTCRSGRHGNWQVRGWKNTLYALVAERVLRPTKEIRRYLGDELTWRAYDYGKYSDGPGTMICG